MIKSSDFYYHLPKSLIANHPAEPRDSSRLMIINRKDQTISHAIFHDIIALLQPNDVLVLNETKVFPARLSGQKKGGGNSEILLIKPLGDSRWECLGKNLKIGSVIQFSNQISATILSKNSDAGTALVDFFFQGSQTLEDLIKRQGHTPIPPYIHSNLSETDLRRRYQTIYAKQKGSVAAPTAGLHFTPQLLSEIQNLGVQIEKVTLHVGPGTFGTLYPHHIKNRQLHAETYHIDHDTYDRLHTAKKTDKRIIAVGTTTCRTLETVFGSENSIEKTGETTLFIMPPHRFHFVEALITNFHLPESSLLMLVTAFVSAPNTPTPFTSFADSLMGKAYQMAVDENYRFFSFGDAMFIA